MPFSGIGSDILNWPITLKDIAKVMAAAGHLEKVAKNYKLDKPVSLVCGSAFAKILHEFVPKQYAEFSAELLVNAVFSPAPRPSTPQWPSEEDRSNGMNDDCDWPWSAARTE